MSKTHTRRAIELELALALQKCKSHLLDESLLIMSDNKVRFAIHKISTFEIAEEVAHNK